MKIWSSQGKVSPNLKYLLRGLLLWYAPPSWWHRVPCLGNINDVWWMRRSLDYPSSPSQFFPLKPPAPPTSTSFLCPSTFHWWGRRGAASGLFLRLFPDGWVGGARFVALCFVNFSRFSIFCGVWIGPFRIIRTFLFLWMKTDKKIPRCLYLWRTRFENVGVWRTCST